MLVTNQSHRLITKVSIRTAEDVSPPSRSKRCRSVHLPPDPSEEQKSFSPVASLQDLRFPRAATIQVPEKAKETDPLYLFACYMQWESSEEPTAGWELIAAAQSLNPNTRAHAQALLSKSHLGGSGLGGAAERIPSKRCRANPKEIDMNAPYGLEIVDNCTECKNPDPAYFCAFSDPVLQSLDQVSHKSVLPAGAILFVEGQDPRGLFVICSGKVNVSTTSREGKILILRTAMAGEVLGLSASISGFRYEITAEAATPCQVSFIDRKHFLELMQRHSETGLHAAKCLSRDYHSAYRDIHHLVLTRSSSGKLARLLLSQASLLDTENETRIPAEMTHEEMGQRIGASRETVTRLLTRLRKKRLIRLDGADLVIRDRTALEELAV